MAYYPLYHLSTHYHGYCVLNTPTTLYNNLSTHYHGYCVLSTPTTLYTTSPLITMVTVCSILQLPSIPLFTHYHGYCVFNTPTTLYTTSPLITMVTACSILLLPSIPPLHSLPWLLCAQYSNYPLYHLSTHYHGYCVLNTPTTLYTTSPLITMVTACSILLLPSIPPLHSLPWLLYHLSTHYHGYCVLNTPTTLYTTSPLITMVTVCSILQRSMNMNFKLCSLGTCLSNFRLCPSNFRALAFVSSHKKALS